MKIAYLGIDLLKEALQTVLEENCEVMRLFSCKTDNITEFNTGVLRMAEQAGIAYTLERITKEDLDTLAAQGCELLLCAGYYHRVPVTDAFPMINLHPAPLPRYRGAWPMPVLLRRGEREGGICLHKMGADFDTGDIVLERTFPLERQDTLADYMRKAKALIPSMVRELLRNLPELLAHARPQGAGAYVPCPKQADWTVNSRMDVATADAVLRAFYGYECIYETRDQSFEMIGARAVAPGRPEAEYPLRDGEIVAGQVRLLHTRSALQLGQRTQVEEIRRRCGHELSAHAFTSLYLWQKSMGLKLQLDSDVFAVRMGDWERNTWFFPCGTHRGMREFLDAHDGEKLRLVYLRAQDARWLEENEPGKWELKRDRSADEYIYHRQEHIDLAGRRYGHIRWRINKIERELSPRTELINTGNIADALWVAKAWEAQESKPGVEAFDDRDVTVAALESWDALDMQGVVIYLQNRPAAFMLGFELAENTFDAMVGKCAENVQGLTYYAIRELFRALPERYEWVNLEEDLGLRGLRDMKMHFLPNRTNEVWEARRI